MGGLLVSFKNILVGLSHPHYVRGFGGLKLRGMSRLLGICRRRNVFVRRRGKLMASTRFHSIVQRVMKGPLASRRVSST